jgi:TPR repeat protein
MRLFEVAARGGDARAEQYLLKAYTDRQGQQFSLEKATTLMIAVIQDASADRVASRLNGLAKSHKTVYEQLLARIDLTSIYERSAQSGDPVGMREYAKLKLANSGGAEAASSATDLFRKAADKGDSEAMVLLAQNYAYGIGTRPSLPEAKLWLEKAARLGSKQANEMLSVMSTKVN